MSQYDPIARRYEHSKAATWREAVELPTFMRLLGDVRGRKALDLGCGNGHFTRILRRAGASKVVGIDSSPAMIDLALAHEADDTLGIEYRCGPAQDLARLDAFDVVTAAYLLNHATTRRELTEMLEAIRSNLQPGGRFVALNSAMDHEEERDLRKYGMYARIGPAPAEGQPFTVSFIDGDGTFEVVNYHWTLDTYERAMVAAGFQDITWHRGVVVGPNTKEASGFWNELAERPPFIGITARRTHG